MHALEILILLLSLPLEQFFAGLSITHQKQNMWRIFKSMLIDLFLQSI